MKTKKNQHKKIQIKIKFPSEKEGIKNISDVVETILDYIKEDDDNKSIFEGLLRKKLIEIVDKYGEMPEGVDDAEKLCAGAMSVRTIFTELDAPAILLREFDKFNFCNSLEGVKVAMNSDLEREVREFAEKMAKKIKKALQTQDEYKRFEKLIKISMDIFIKSHEIAKKTGIKPVDAVKFVEVFSESPDVFKKMNRFTNVFAMSNKDAMELALKMTFEANRLIKEKK
jgi:hypothetical protein